jgi:hypothetical protein
MIRHDARQNLELDVGHNCENKCQTHVKHDGAEGVHIALQCIRRPHIISVKQIIWRRPSCVSDHRFATHTVICEYYGIAEIGKLRPSLCRNKNV